MLSFSRGSDGDCYRTKTNVCVEHEQCDKQNLLQNMEKESSDDTFDDICLQPSYQNQNQILKLKEQQIKNSGILNQTNWSKIAPYLALLLAGIAFSGMHVFTKEALNYMPPQGMAFFRVTLALPPLALMAGFREMPPKYPIKTHFTHVMLGFLGVGCAQSLVFVGNNLAGPDIVSVMQPTIPIYVSIYSIILKIEKFSYWKIVGQALSIAGCLTLVQIDHIDFSNQVALGTVIMVLQTMSYAGFLIIMNSHVKNFPYPLTAFFRASCWGWVCTGIVFFGTNPRIAWGALPWWVWVSVVYSGIVVSFIAHSLVAWAVAKVQAVIPALSTCLQPLLTSFMAWVFLGELLRIRDIFAMVAIMIGLFVVVWAKFKEASTNSQIQQIKNQTFLEENVQLVKINHTGQECDQIQGTKI